MLPKPRVSTSGLDGSLCKFLLEKVQDPVCHAAFEKINGDEARHLGVDFHVLDMLGHGKSYQLGLRFAAQILNLELMIGILTYLPLLNKMRDNLMGLGLP